MAGFKTGVAGLALRVWRKQDRESVRRLTLADVDAVMAIESCAYRFGWTHGIFRDCVRVGYECWALFSDDVMMGYAIMSFSPGEAHILNVCVAPQHQNHGYGRLLMEHCIQVATEHGSQKMWLEVRPSNLAAVHLYERLGFQIIARRPRYYPSESDREDALVLSRRLFTSLR